VQAGLWARLLHRTNSSAETGQDQQQALEAPRLVLAHSPKMQMGMQEDPPRLQVKTRRREKGVEKMWMERQSELWGPQMARPLEALVPLAARPVS
jgi:hypothetical protein